MSHQNTNFDEKAMAMLLLKTQEQLMQLMAQHQINSPNKELPQELQQLLDNQIGRASCRERVLRLV